MQSKIKGWLRKTNPRKKHNNGAQQGETTRKIFIPRNETIGSSPNLRPPQPYDTDRSAVSERSASSHSDDESRSGFSPAGSIVPTRSNTLQSRDGDYRDYTARREYRGRHESVGSGGTASNHSKAISLGGNPKLMKHASVKKYNEDVADRNIEETRSGFMSSGNSSSLNLDTMEHPGELPSLQRKTTTRRNSAVGSIGAASLAEILYEVEHDSGEEPGAREQYQPNRAKWPVRQPRDESRMNRRKRRGSDDSIDDNAPRPSNFGPRVQRPGLKGRRSSSATGVGSIPLRVPRVSDNAFDGDGVADLGYSEDVDCTTQWAPAVTHEHVSRTTQHYVTEHITRDIHTHDVYHHIQPVIDTEILPPKHYIPDPDDPSKLKEVSLSAIPPNTYESWYIGDKEIEPPRSTAQTDFTNVSTSSTDSGFESSPQLKPTASPTTASRTPRPTRKPVSSSSQALTNAVGTSDDTAERNDSIMMSPTTLTRLTSRNGRDSDGSSEKYVDASESTEHSDGLDGVPDKSPLTLREVLQAMPAVDGSSDDDDGIPGIVPGAYTDSAPRWTPSLRA